MLKVFIASAVASAALGVATQSQAFTVRRSAVECFVSTTGEFNNMAGGVISNNSTNSLFVYCPTPEDATIRAQNITTINVHGKDASSADWSEAQVCFNNWNDDGGNCRNLQRFGTPANPSAIGQFGLQLGAPNFTSTWPSGEEGHFKYVMVRLGRKGSGSWDPSTLRGIFFAGSP
jgi:hypothetical protein